MVSFFHYCRQVGVKSSFSEWVRLHFRNMGGRVLSSWFNLYRIPTGLSQVDYLSGGVDCLLPFEDMDTWTPLLLQFLNRDKTRKREEKSAIVGTIPREYEDPRQDPQVMRVYKSIEQFLLPDFALWDRVSSSAHKDKVYNMLSHGNVSDWKPSWVM